MSNCLEYYLLLFFLFLDFSTNEVIFTCLCGKVLKYIESKLCLNFIWFTNVINKVQLKKLGMTKVKLV